MAHPYAGALLERAARMDALAVRAELRDGDRQRADLATREAARLRKAAGR